MKKNYYILLLLAIFFVSCKKQNNEDIKEDSGYTGLVDKLDPNFISLDEALKMASTVSKPNGKFTTIMSSVKLKSGGYKNIEEKVIASDNVKKTIKNYFTYSESTKNIALKSTSNQLNDEPLLYLINYEGGGASIVSSDKRFGGVIATLDNGITFTQDMAAPDDFINFLVHAAQTIKKIKENKLVSPNPQLLTENKPKLKGTPEEECDGEFYYPYGTLNWTCMWFEPGAFYPGSPGSVSQWNYYVSTPPLVQAQWGQGTGYNNLVPLTCGTGKAPVGCVATAMAQALSVFQYPSTYQWSTMNNFSGTPETARLMRDLGTMVNMSYACDGSGAYMEKANEAFNQLGINSHYVSHENSNTLETFKTWIDNRLINFREPGQRSSSSPLMVGGCRITGQTGWWIFRRDYYSECHAFLIDGYRKGVKTSENLMAGYDYRHEVFHEESYHFNFGWDGNFNGWYKLNYADLNGYVDPSISFIYGLDLIFDIYI